MSQVTPILTLEDLLAQKFNFHLLGARPPHDASPEHYNASLDPIFVVLNDDQRRQLVALAEPDRGTIEDYLRDYNPALHKDIGVFAEDAWLLMQQDRAAAINAWVEEINAVVEKQLRTIRQPSAQKPGTALENAPSLQRNHVVEIDYTNYKGERGVRKILPGKLEFTSSEYHPQPQWLLHAWDMEKKAMRSFAWNDIHDIHHTGAKLPRLGEGFNGNFHEQAAVSISAVDLLEASGLISMMGHTVGTTNWAAAMWAELKNLHERRERNKKGA